MVDFSLLLSSESTSQLNLFQILSTRAKPIRRSDLVSKTGISHFVIQQSLEKLNENLRMVSEHSEIIYTKEARNILVFLKKDKLLNFQDILSIILKNDLNYQILLELVEKSQTTTFAIINKFNLSESAFYSNLRRINLFLKEYNLKIKSGKLVGKEKNICYFSYHFFWGSLSLIDIESKFKNYGINLMVEYIEKKISYRFSRITRLKILVWTTIIQQRSNVADFKDKAISKFINDIVKDPFFDILKRGYNLMNNASAIENSIYSPIYLYLFFKSLYILPSSVITDKKEMTQSYRVEKNIDALNKIIINQLSLDFHINFEEIEKKIEKLDWLYYIEQIHSQLIFFNQYISPLISVNDLYFKQMVSDFVYSEAKKIVAKIQRFVGITFDSMTINNLEYIYSNLLRQIEIFSGDVVHIGIHSYISPLRASFLRQTINELYKNKYHISYEIAEPFKKYDLLISDTSNLDFSFKFDELFITNEADLYINNKSLNKLIRTISERKKLG